MRAEDHRDAPPTDLSLAVLRSVSPVHMQPAVGPGVVPHGASAPAALPRAHGVRVHGPDPVAADCPE
ncbi:hypothetical protein G6F68_021203 [Rhizopus microsporus]|nr:hypothetical protein G6F68_021203 [Rhizopus microsporus]